MFKTSFSLIIIAGFICLSAALGGFAQPAKAVSIEIKPPKPTIMDTVIIHVRAKIEGCTNHDSTITSSQGAIFDYQMWITNHETNNITCPAFFFLDIVDTVGSMPTGTYSVLTTWHWHFTDALLDSLCGGSYVFEKRFTVTGPTDILETTDAVPPSAFTLMQNYPNPFNSGTTISFHLQEPADVELLIYDILGRPVRRLASAVYPAGEHPVFFDGSDRYGHPLPSGIYFCRATAGRQSVTRRMALIK